MGCQSGPRTLTSAAPRICTRSLLRPHAHILSVRSTAASTRVDCRLRTHPHNASTGTYKHTDGREPRTHKTTHTHRNAHRSNTDTTPPQRSVPSMGHFPTPLPNTHTHHHSPSSSSPSSSSLPSSTSRRRCCRLCLRRRLCLVVVVVFAFVVVVVVVVFAFVVVVVVVVVVAANNVR